MIPEETIDEIRNKSNIAEIIGEYIHLTARGDHLWGLSPFKDEKTPSFAVTPSKQMYYCFSTQKGGNVFTFLMEMEGFTYPEAVEYLGKKIGIDVLQQKGFSKDIKEQKVLEELYGRIAESFHFLLTSSPIGKQALEYVRGRGLTDETIKLFYLGYSHPDPRWLYAFLQKKGYSSSFLQKTALFSQKNPQWSLFSQRLMFPIWSHQGEIVGFGGRIMAGNGPKYINSPDNPIFHKRKNLYGLNLAKAQIKQTQTFILCEGYFDVIAFHQAGITNAVAPLGTATTAEQVKLLRRHANKGIIIFDGDEAGRNATNKVALLMESEGIDCWAMKLDTGQDPADILVKNGSQGLQNVVSLSVSILDFMIEKATLAFDKNTPNGKERILEQLFPYINSITSPVKQEDSLHIIAEHISVSFQSVKETWKQKMRVSARRTSLPEQIDATQQHYAVDPELLLMVALTIYPEHFAQIRSELENIRGKQACLLYSLLEEHYRSGKLEFKKIVDAIDNKSLRDLIMKKASRDEYGDNPKEYIHSALWRVRSEWLRERRKEVELLVRKAERNNDQKILREALEEKLYIDSELEKFKPENYEEYN